MSIGGAKFVHDGSVLNPEMIKTETSGFSKNAMEREITTLEQTMIPSPLINSTDKPILTK